MWRFARTRVLVVVAAVVLLLPTGSTARADMACSITGGSGYLAWRAVGFSARITFGAVYMTTSGCVGSAKAVQGEFVTNPGSLGGAATPFACLPLWNAVQDLGREGATCIISNDIVNGVAVLGPTVRIYAQGFGALGMNGPGTLLGNCTIVIPVGGSGNDTCYF